MGKELTYTQRVELEQNIVPEKIAKNDKKTNKDFQKIFYDSFDLLIQLNMKSPTALNIYMLFMKYAETNNTVYLTVDMIMNTLHICKQTACNSLELLMQDGYLTTYKVGRNNFYFLNPSVGVSCNVPFQKKLALEYATKIDYDLKSYKKALEELEDEPEPEKIKLKKPANWLCDVDKSMVDTSVIDRADRLKMKATFYNNHPELHEPTEEEIIQQHKDDDFLNSMLTPFGELKEPF